MSELVGQEILGFNGQIQHTECSRYITVDNDFIISINRNGNKLCWKINDEQVESNKKQQQPPKTVCSLGLTAVKSSFGQTHITVLVLLYQTLKVKCLLSRIESQN